MREAVRSADLTFLNMDRTTNLMVVNGLFWFDEKPNWDAVAAVVAARLVARYPLLSRRPVNVNGTWMWEDDPGFDLARHLHQIVLRPTDDAGADLAAAQTYIAERITQPLPRDRPLWELDLVSGLSGHDGGPVALALGRFHHGMADGIRLVQLMLSLGDVGEDVEATPPTVGRGPASAGLTGRTVGLGKQLIGDAVDFGGGVISASVRSLLRMPSQIAQLRPDDVPAVLERTIGYVISPTHLTDAITGVASQDNQLVNSVRSAGRLALAGHSPDVLGEPKPGVAKRVAWVSGIDLAEVKAIGRRHDATVNDVLIAAVARGLTQYVREKGLEPVEAVNWLVPVSLKPVDGNLPTELGNHFAMVMFPMPLGSAGHDVSLTEITSRMTRTKNSAEAMMVYGLQKAIAETPQAVSVGLTDFVANKTVGVLTNVPGPQTPLYLAGERRARMGPDGVGPVVGSLHLQLRRHGQHRHHIGRRSHAGPRAPRGTYQRVVRHTGGRGGDRVERRPVSRHLTVLHFILLSVRHTPVRAAATVPPTPPVIGLRGGGVCPA